MKPTTPILCMLLALAASGAARAQDGWQSASAPQLWHDFNPQGSRDGQGIYHEVLSRCTAEGRQRMYDPDPVTWCHEATHEVNSRIRNSIGGNVNGFYVGKGKCAVLAEPRVTLATVAQYVGQQYRTAAFKLYLIDAQQYWNNQPLYVLDEYSAYINGAQACRELGGARSPGSDDMHCDQFSYFADCLVAAVRQHDPNYAQLDQLVEFIDYQKYRIRYMRGERSREGQQVAQSCINGQCYPQQQGYRVIQKPVQRQSPPQPQGPNSPVQPTQPNPGTISTSEEIKQEWLTYINNTVNTTVNNKLEGKECQCDPDAASANATAITNVTTQVTSMQNDYDAKILQITNLHAELAQSVVNIDARVTELETLKDSLDHDTPIRVYYPDGRLAGESKTNLFRGEAIDFTFDPRALLDSASGE